MAIPPNPPDPMRRIRLAVSYLEKLCSHPAFFYVLSASTALASVALWYNFNLPPINSNLGFVLFPGHQLALSTSLYNPYIWPGSFVPSAFGTPTYAYYAMFLDASAGNYAWGLFLSIITLDISGAVCLFYLASRWLAQFSLRKEWAYLSVVVYSFNAYKVLSGFGTTDGYFSAGILGDGDPALIVILAYLTYLALFRSPKYALLLGAFSFLAFANFPNSTLVLAGEYVALLVVLLAYRVSLAGKDSFRARLRRTIRPLLAILGSVVVANIYLVLPLLVSFSSYFGGLSSSNPSYAFSFSFDQIQTLPNSIRLISNWSLLTAKAPPWVATYLRSPFPILLSWFVPALSFGSLYFLRRARDQALYALMLGCVLLATSSNPPAGAAFVWLATNVLAFRPYYNGETFSPLLLLFYCLFAPFTAAMTAGRLESWAGEAKSTASSAASNASPVGLRPRHSSPGRVWSAVMAVSTCVVILLASYPMLTSEFSSSAALNYPLSSQLPAYYSQANDYLQSRNPSAPVMVFPEVEQFDGNSVNGSTWYQGIDIYPGVIQNPSISSVYPDNYQGGDGSTLPTPGLVYTLGNVTCANENCLDHGNSVLENIAVLEAHDGEDLAVNDSPQVQWESAFSTDGIAFRPDGSGTSMVMTVNASVYEPNGHWFLGYFSSPLNVAEYGYVLVNYSLQGATPAQIQFGYHSFTEYGAGNGYYLSNYTTFAQDDSDLVAIPLASPSVHGQGSPTNVTNVYFRYNSTAAGTGNVVLTVNSVRFAYSPPASVSYWRAGNAGDELGQVSDVPSIEPSLRVDESKYESNGHWLLGYYARPVNLSSDAFLIVNYTLVNVDPEYLQFGFHSYTNYGAGNGYLATDSVTVTRGGRLTSIIPLDAPEIEGGGSLSNVTNVFAVYQPPSSAQSTGFINISSMRVAPGSPDGSEVIASALSRMGVQFAYVDTSIIRGQTQPYSGDYYDTMFGSSADFRRVFHEGTITIFQDLLYNGLFSTTSDVANTPSVASTLDGLSFPYLSVYYNSTNSNLTYLSSLGPRVVSGIKSPKAIPYASTSSTHYRVDLSESSWSYLVFRSAYSSSWTATLANGTVLREHVEVDGIGNGWLVPPGNYSVTISFVGENTYSALELVALFVPVPMLILFLAVVQRPTLARLFRAAIKRVR